MITGDYTAQLELDDERITICLKILRICSNIQEWRQQENESSSLRFSTTLGVGNLCRRESLKLVFSFAFV